MQHAISSMRGVVNEIIHRRGPAVSTLEGKQRGRFGVRSLSVT